MKTKLLKKIRRRFLVYYYPNNEYGSQFEVLDLKNNVRLGSFRSFHPTRQLCLDIVLSVVHREYEKYSRAYKKRQIRTKVWHESNS